MKGKVRIEYSLREDGTCGATLFYIGTGGALQQIFNGGPLTDTTGWHHVAVTYDGAFVKMYQDAVEVVSD
jgi:hypothetical protein